MLFYTETVEKVLKETATDINVGLTDIGVEKSRKKHGANVLSKQRKKTFFEKVFTALKEPMMIILVVSFLIAFGTCLGIYFKT